MYDKAIRDTKKKKVYYPKGQLLKPQSNIPIEVKMSAEEVDYEFENMDIAAFNSKIDPTKDIVT